MRQEKFEYKIGDAAFSEAQVDSKSEENGAMSNISEHNSEKEGESDNSKESWVGFLISRHTIGFDNLLGRWSETITSKASWVFFTLGSLELGSRNFHHRFDQGNKFLEFSNIVFSDIDFSFQEVIVYFHLVEIVVQLSFFHHVQLQILESFEGSDLFRWWG